MEYIAEIRIKNTPFPVLSFEEFQKRKGLETMRRESLYYNMNKGTLDFISIGVHRFIVWNEKAEEFKLQIRRPNTRKNAFLPPPQ